MVGGAGGMSGLASCRGVLRRSVSNSGISTGLISEVSKQIADHCEPANSGISEISLAPTSREQSSGLEDFTPQLQDLLSDIRSLDNAVKQLDASNSEAQRTIDHIGSTIEHVPPPQRSPSESCKIADLCHAYPAAAFARTPLPDSPTYAAYRQELTAARPVADESPSGKDGLFSDGFKLDNSATLEEVHASNRMLQRALSAVQKRLKAVEKERDVLRAERDHFKCLSQRFPFAPAVRFPVPAGVWPQVAPAAVSHQQQLQQQQQQAQQQQQQQQQQPAGRDPKQTVQAGLASLGISGPAFSSCATPAAASMSPAGPAPASIGA